LTFCKRDGSGRAGERECESLTFRRSANFADVGFAYSRYFAVKNSLKKTGSTLKLGFDVTEGNLHWIAVICGGEKKIKARGNRFLFFFAPQSTVGQLWLSRGIFARTN
jgi:hypothetical protein